MSVPVELAANLFRGATVLAIHSAIDVVDATIERTKVKLLSALRQLFAAILYTVGLCHSGRHHHHDRSARAMCCNGWRRCWSYVSIDGRLTPVASWRPITLADP